MLNKKVLFALFAFVVISSLVVALFTGCKITTEIAATTTAAAETSAGETTKAEESTTTAAANKLKTGGIMRIHINEPV